MGKSWTIREQYEPLYVKPINKWWDGYNGEPYVLIDDIDPDHSFLGHFLKIWADRYPFRADTKGGFVHIRPQRIFITSNHPPQDIFKTPEAVAAIQRRFNIEHIVNAEDEPILGFKKAGGP